jgi:hypothetical protein
MIFYLYSKRKNLNGGITKKVLLGRVRFKSDQLKIKIFRAINLKSGCAVITLSFTLVYLMNQLVITLA